MGHHCSALATAEMVVCVPLSLAAGSLVSMQRGSERQYTVCSCSVWSLSCTTSSDHVEVQVPGMGRDQCLWLLIIFKEVEDQWTATRANF